MRSRLLNWPVLGLGGIVVAAALFGGGLLAGKALDGDDGSTPATTDGNGDGEGLVAAGPDIDGSLTAPNAGANPANPASQAGRNTMGGDDGAESAADVARGGYGYGAGIPESYYGCEALLGDVIDGTTLDPSSAGITPKLLGSGYQLIRLSLYAQGDCPEQGEPVVGEPVLESQWRHTETGVTVSLTQRILGEAVANVQYETSATVVADGYVFTVNGWNNVYYYDDVAEDLPADGNATDPAVLPPPSQEDVSEVIRAVLAEIAPSVPANCYFTQTQGSWSDLASFGVGDPRSAVPSGFTENNFNLFTFTAPDASCPDSGAEPPQGNSFWAQWSADNSRSYLEVNVYRNEYAGEEDWPGNIDEWGANWTSNGYSFGVWGSDSDGGLGVETITAIARALDPQFSSQCLISLTPLDSAALAEIGIGVPSAEGLEIINSDLNRRGVAPGCPDSGDYTNYELNWTLEGDSGFIEVHAWIGGSDDNSGERWGYIHDEGVEWGYNNRNFSIWGKAIDGESQRDLLIEVARSIDPNFDPDNLDDGGGARPLPVEPDGGIGDSGSAPASDAGAEAEAAAAESGAR